MILWKWEICHHNLAQSTPELRVMDLLSQMALRGHWGLFFPSLSVPAKTPAAPSVLFIKYTVQLCVYVRVCVCVCVCKCVFAWGELLGGVGDTCYCCSTGICHKNGMSCQTERPFPAVGLQQRDAS